MGRRLFSLRKIDYSFFKVAREVSFLSTYHGARIGAVVVDGRHIISSGANGEKTNPTQARYNSYRFKDSNTLPKVHAEVAALNPLIGRKEIDFTRLSIYVYRELKTGERALARPCKSCMALCKDLGIRKVFYSTPDGFAEELIGR